MFRGKIVLNKERNYNVIILQWKDSSGGAGYKHLGRPKWSLRRMSDLLTFEQERVSVEKENNLLHHLLCLFTSMKDSYKPKAGGTLAIIWVKKLSPRERKRVAQAPRRACRGTRERWRLLSGNDRNLHRLVAFWFLAIGVSSLMQSYSFAKSPTKGKQVSFFYTDFHTKHKDVLAAKTPTAWVVSLDREGFKW